MKRFFAVLSAVLCFLVPTAQAADSRTESTVSRFTDVSDGDWYYSAVEFVVKEGMMNGFSEHIFSPGSETTRGMLMTVLARHAGANTDGSDPWYQAGMDWAVAQGVSDGTSPEAAITREQFAVMLWRYADKPAAVGGFSAFSDADSVSSWAIKGMTWAVQNKIIIGGDNRLRPQDPASRAEAAAMLMRFCAISLGPKYEAAHGLGAVPPELTDGLELPVGGATGYASVKLRVWRKIPAREAAESGGADVQLAELEPGTAFRILREERDWWYITLEQRGETISGYIEHRYCMINLPDVIPSIIYNDTNAYSSLFRSVGKDIPGVTGRAFYNSGVYNARLGKTEFIMPMLYAAARDVCAAQHRALAEGNCLVIYQAFRPLDTQRKTALALSRMAETDDEVRMGVSTSPWTIDWFIAANVSNHQRGYALDVSMVKVYRAETRSVGGFSFLEMVEYEDYSMPTEMHELSRAAVSTISPASSELSETMNRPAIALRQYFTASGFSPLASEWWHFDHNNARLISSDHPSTGLYFLTECLSRTP